MARQRIRVEDLDRKTQRVVTRSVRRQLARLQKECAAAQGGEDPEALHRFRVDVRRALGTLGAFGRGLAKARADRAIRALKRLNHASGAARDLEVQIAWIGADGARPGGVTPRALQGLVGDLEEAKRRADIELAEELPRLFARAEDAVERWLEGADSRSKSRATQRFRNAAAARLERTAQELSSRLARIEGPRDDEKMHRARIRAKALRFQLESLGDCDPDASEAAAGLRALQDQLGELNDLRLLSAVLEERMRRSAVARAEARLAAARAGDEAELRRGMRRVGEDALLALDRRIALRREDLHADFSATWLGDRTAAPLDAVPRIAEALRSPDRGAAVEKPKPARSREAGPRLGAAELC